MIFGLGNFVIQIPPCGRPSEAEEAEGMGIPIGMSLKKKKSPVEEDESREDDEAADFQDNLGLL